jgi:UDP-N-acetylmuramoylalanine--D-glutamate ligase
VNHKEHFKGKKATVLGLGLLGRGLNDVIYLASHGADLVVTDLKKESDLKTSIDAVEAARKADLALGNLWGTITYVLGEHRLEDFRGKDFILKAAGVPIDSPFVAEARKNGIPIEMDESLFVKLAPPIKVVGITGTRGKTTTTSLIYEILHDGYEGTATAVHLGGNLKGMATLPLLDVVKPGDIVVLELSSWQLQGFGEAHASPNVAVFTNLMSDHMNYYKGDMGSYFGDKANIFKFQTSKDTLVAGEEVAKMIKSSEGPARGKLVVPTVSDIFENWKIQVKGRHNLENVALAMAAARALGVEDESIRKSIEAFKGVEGRMQKIREVNGVEIYNDTTATTPDATLAALKALSTNKNVVLIMGGADKTLDMDPLISNIEQYVDSVVLLAGSGSMKVQQKLLALKNVRVEQADSLDMAVHKAMGIAREGEVLLFSPAFASFGMFKNEYDRGEQFARLVEKL